MNRSIILLAVALFAATIASRKLEAAPADAPPRGMKVVVAQDAPVPIRQAADQIVAAAASSPLLRIMSDGKPAELIFSGDLAKADPQERAFNHLVLVGLPDDPMIKQAWLRDAHPINSDGVPGLYIFGFGNLLGDIGYIESDRNPFLHSVVVKQTPYETEIVTISGSTPAGVKLAANAFLKNGLINGVVASNWKRGETTLLDRDPQGPDASLPTALPEQLGPWIRIGVTQPGEDEYRGVLADAGAEPEIIWRAKYYLPGVWDGAGAANSLKDYSAGLHRRSYGNTFWAANFGNSSQAADAASKIAAAAHLKKQKSDWVGKLGPLGPEKASAGSLRLQQHGEWVLMSTVSDAAE